MKTLAIVASAGAAAMLGGCVIVDADVRERDWDSDRYGYVYGAEVSVRDPEVTILVHSNGCTNKEDFDVDVRDRSRDVFDIGFRRINPDNCKALMPEGRRITWSFAELGIPRNAAVFVINRVGR